MDFLGDEASILTDKGAPLQPKETAMDYSTMNKDELRTACKAAGIAYGKLNNDAMRAALILHGSVQPVRAAPVCRARR